MNVEEALRVGDAQLHLILPHLPVFVWSTDADLRLIAFRGGG